MVTGGKVHHDITSVDDRTEGILVQQIDLVPTILDLAKAPAPGNLRGRSLVPLLGVLLIRKNSKIAERFKGGDTAVNGLRFVCGWTCHHGAACD